MRCTGWNAARDRCSISSRWGRVRRLLDDAGLGPGTTSRCPSPSTGSGCPLPEPERVSDIRLPETAQGTANAPPTATSSPATPASWSVGETIRLLRLERRTPRTGNADCVEATARRSFLQHCWQIQTRRTVSWAQHPVPGRGVRGELRSSHPIASSRVPRLTLTATNSGGLTDTRPTSRRRVRRPDVPVPLPRACSFTMSSSSATATFARTIIVGSSSSRQRALSADARWHGLQLRLLVQRRRCRPHHRRQHIDNVRGDASRTRTRASDAPDELDRQARSPRARSVSPGPRDRQRRRDPVPDRALRRQTARTSPKSATTAQRRTTASADSLEGRATATASGPGRRPRTTAARVRTSRALRTTGQGSDVKRGAARRPYLVRPTSSTASGAVAVDQRGRSSRSSRGGASFARSMSCLEHDEPAVLVLRDELAPMRPRSFAFSEDHVVPPKPIQHMAEKYTAVPVRVQGVPGPAALPRCPRLGRVGELLTDVGRRIARRRRPHPRRHNQ